ncbi:MAG: cytosine permease, partial [Nitrososphaerota archaeon]|nr:cytosine permease [Nitrososphaerota archaeon]
MPWIQSPSLERLGIEHVDKERRHGRPFSTFTLWFGANLTIADFALGSLLFGLPLSSIVIAVVIGNIAGGLLVGLMASMGPNFGYPQMMISRTVMGSRGNIPFALANWVSTVGWFTVNIVLGGYALQLAFGIPFYVAAPTSTIDFNLNSGDEIKIEERSPKELTHFREEAIAPEGAEAVNL